MINLIDSIADGRFSDGDHGLFRPIVDALLEHDEYLLLADFASYVECWSTSRNWPRKWPCSTTTPSWPAP